jgi:hypothetical protein
MYNSMYIACFVNGSCCYTLSQFSFGMVVCVSLIPILELVTFLHIVNFAILYYVGQNTIIEDSSYLWLKTQENSSSVMVRIWDHLSGTRGTSLILTVPRAD